MTLCCRADPTRCGMRPDSARLGRPVAVLTH